MSVGLIADMADTYSWGRRIDLLVPVSVRDSTWHPLVHGGLVSSVPTSRFVASSHVRCKGGTNHANFRAVPSLLSIKPLAFALIGLQLLRKRPRNYGRHGDHGIHHWL